jgi:signal transduction histidine kinase/CheY-like chemotaxis protein
MRLFCQPNPRRAHLFHALSIAGALCVSGVVLAMTPVAFGAVVLWLSLVLTAELLTTGVNLRLAQRPPPDASLPMWSRIKTATSALQGAAYAAGPLLLHVPDSATSVLAPAWAILTVTVGIVYACAPWPPALYSMATASVLPAALGLFLIGGQIEMTLAVCMAIALPFTLVIGTMAIRTTGDLIQARLEVTGLLAQQTALTGRVTEMAADRTRFFSAASHDLRQPLQALGFYTTLLSTADRRETVIDEVLPRLIDCADALDRQFNAILGVTSADSTLTRSRPRSLALQPVLQRVVGAFQPEARAKGLSLRSCRTGLSTFASEDVLDRVLFNLVSNAVRYTDVGGVLLGARKRGAEVEVIVADTGVGIPPAELERIFDDYVQLANPGRQSLSSKKSGFGLGLSIVRRLCIGMGWTVTVRSRLARGSIFSLRLPAALPSEIHQHGNNDDDPLDETTPQAAAGPSRQPVLVVDDDPLIRDATSRILANWHIPHATVGTTAEALTELGRLQAEGPVTVLVDYRLGDDIDGLEFSKLIQELWPDRVYPILLTGETNEAILEKARAMALMVLAKPIKPIRLRAALTAVG